MITRDSYVSHTPTARAATVATQVWRKLYTEIMSWISEVYECCLCMALTWSNLMNKICTAFLWAVRNRWSVAVQTSKLPCVLQLNLVLSTTGQRCCTLVIAFHLLSRHEFDLRKIFSISLCSFMATSKQTSRLISVGFTQAEYYKHWTWDPRTRDPRTQILEGCVVL